MGKSSAENEQKSTGPFYYEIFEWELYEYYSESCSFYMVDEKV